MEFCDRTRHDHGCAKFARSRIVQSLLVRGALAGGLLANPVQAAPSGLTVTTSGVISSGSDPNHLFGAATDLAGQSYTLVEEFDSLGPSYYSSGSSASNIGDPLTGFVAATVEGKTIKTAIATSSGATLSADAFTFYATNTGTDARGDLVGATQNVSSSTPVIVSPDLLSWFSYILASDAYGSDSYRYNDAAFTQSVSFNGTPASIVYRTPEPASAAALAAGLIAVGLVRGRRRT